MEREQQPYEKLRNKLTGSAESLCAFCGNACNNGCSWSEDFVPVEGWEAVINKNGYFVESCPEYCSDKWMHEDSNQLDTEGCLRLMEALIRTVRDDYIYMPRARPSIERFIKNPQYSNLFFFADPDEIIAQFRKEMRHSL